jgi:hypothetical protein
MTDITGTNELFDGSSTRQLFGDWGTTWQIYAGSFVDTEVVATTGMHIVTVLFNGASSVIRLDGSEIGSGNPGSNALSTMTLGRGGSTTPLGYFFEIVVYDSAEGVTANEAGLMTKWGIT